MIDVRIMADKRRTEQAEAIYVKLSAMPFGSVRIVWDEHGDEWETGSRAWLIPSEAEYVCVLQDDAIVSSTFYENLVQAINSCPNSDIISLYLGTSRPYPNSIKRAVRKADALGANWITGNTLHHGVGFVMRTELITEVIKQVENVKEMQYDNRIGWYFQMIKQPVYYTHPQLVDHDDSLPSLTGHDKNRQPRVAHRFVGEKAVEWNNKKVEIKYE